MNYFITSNGLPIHVRDSATSAPAVALLHGYLETAAVWDEFIPYIEKACRTISIDLPGHGLSGTAPANTVEAAAQTLHAVLQQAGVAQCVVVGHSMGGYAALAFAERFPEATRGLALFHSTPNADTPQKAAARDRDAARIRRGEGSKLIAEHFRSLFAEANLRRMADALEALEENAWLHDPEGLAASLEGMKQRPDRNRFLASFDKPLLMVFGERDVHIPPEVAQALAARCPQAQTLWLPHAGHLGFLEEPATVGERFVRFLKSIDELPSTAGDQPVSRRSL
ncbi:MAG: alpha/beta hydrolase [Prevotellaceae bacterium]|jgi:pimeloyl-ACP methyl ester carboxylesterase|nr:alpha/beta hydrolase [Prevotellaceae bacterium]